MLKILVAKADFYPWYVLTCVHRVTLIVLSNHRSQINENHYLTCLSNASPFPQSCLAAHRGGWEGWAVSAMAVGSLAERSHINNVQTHPA